MFSFDTWVDIEDVDIEVTIEYNFYEGDKEMLYPNDKAQPGSPNEIEVVSVKDIEDNENELIDILDDEIMEELKEKAENDFEGRNNY